MNNKFLGSINDFIRKIDAKSWPAFFMFAIVLAAAGALNYVTMSPIVGDFIAVAIACFFGVGVLAWHIVESRTDDSEEQDRAHDHRLGPPGDCERPLHLGESLPSGPRGRRPRGPGRGRRPAANTGW